MPRFLPALPLALAIAAAGCSDLPTAPSTTAGVFLSDAVRTAMAEAIADEYRAETTYEAVIGDLGRPLPFVNVLTAEQRHSASIARLFEARGLQPPANDWTVATVPRFATLPAACAAAVTAERENIALYDGYLALELPADVAQVFQRNRTASLVNHLPAFERCAT